MKTRIGFVSNSSSSSFILIAREPITREFLRKEYGWLGAFGAPFVEWLDRYGAGELSYEGDCPPDGPKPGEYFKEYYYTNWDEKIEGHGVVSSSFYHHGWKHLETKNIRVVPGTYHC